MVLPPASDASWRNVVTGKVRLEFKFLAAKVMLGRIVPMVQRNPASIQQCIDELRELFAKNSHLPSAQHDLKQLFG